MNESSKSKSRFTPAERGLLQGRLLDIGAGNDPVTPGAVVFDQAQGDSKKQSWSPRSHNVLGLPGGKLVSLRLNDIGYDRRFAAVLDSRRPPG